MSISTDQHHPIRALFKPMVAALLLVAILAVATRPAFAEATVASQIETFEAREQAVLREVEAGELSEQVGECARALSLALRQDLIRVNADIEALRLELSETSGQRQAEATDKLIQASAERERLVARATRKMNRLTAGVGATPSEAVPRAAAERSDDTPAASTDDALPESGSQGDSESIGDNITITIEPEDLSEPQYLE